MVTEIFCVIGNPVFVIIIIHRRPATFLRQHGTVHLMGGQSVERLRHGFVGQRKRLADGLSLDHFRRHGTAGNGGAAAEGIK